MALHILVPRVPVSFGHVVRETRDSGNRDSPDVRNVMTSFSACGIAKNVFAHAQPNGGWWRSSPTITGNALVMGKLSYYLSTAGQNFRLSNRKCAVIYQLILGAHSVFIRQ